MRRDDLCATLRLGQLRAAGQPTDHHMPRGAVHAALVPAIGFGQQLGARRVARVKLGGLFPQFVALRVGLVAPALGHHGQAVASEGHLGVDLVVHPLAIEDSIKYAQRPKIEDYTREPNEKGRPYVYMVFHGPDIETFKQKLRTKELDIFMSDRYLVTIHDEHFKSIEEVSARCEHEMDLRPPRDRIVGMNPGARALTGATLLSAAALVMATCVFAQSGVGETERFSSDGITFTCPSSWYVTTTCS